METIPGARLLPDPDNDGDSFLVEAQKQQLRIRLYFVDCPETSAGANADAERVQEQMRYFGLTNAEQVIRFGQEARRYAEQALAKPFTVETARANAPGRFGGRVYAFVKVASGEDLADMLVQAGLARAHGMERGNATGIPRQEMSQRLEDLEAAAMLKKAGIWTESNPDRIAEMRRQQRQKLQELDRVRQESKGVRATDQRRIDLNTASVRQLESVAGIGPVLAPRIVQGRPYKSVDDLVRVKGIGKKKLNAIRSQVVVNPKKAVPDPSRSK
ncbi:MAG: helix-hairpin-helix domain-containing protein [Verrucomicrobia bacterium]|nr:helix-hairpin-helix domain-containing protein [Verrucomicrobiota bacterium]